MSEEERIAGELYALVVLGKLEEAACNFLIIPESRRALISDFVCSQVEDSVLLEQWCRITKALEHCEEVYSVYDGVPKLPADIAMEISEVVDMSDDLDLEEITCSDWPCDLEVGYPEYG